MENGVDVEAARFVLLGCSLGCGRVYQFMKIFTMVTPYSGVETFNP